MADVTQLLDAAAAGDPPAAADLLPLIYDELRKLAAARMVAVADLLRRIGEPRRAGAIPSRSRRERA